MNDLEEAKQWVSFGLKNGYIMDDEFWAELLIRDEKKFIELARKAMDLADREAGRKEQK